MTARLLLTGLLASLTLAACAGLSAQDRAAIEDADRLITAAEQHSDGGAERALERGARCALSGVLRRNDAGDGGPGCAP